MPTELDHEASGTRSRLRVKTCSIEGILYGQAFWDTNQELVDYHIVPHSPYHSYIEGDSFRIDTDATGRPVYLESQWNRRNHLIANDLQLPVISATGSVRFLDLRVRFHELSVMSTHCHSVTYIEFERVPVAEHLSLGSGMILGVSADGCLCGLWLVNALPDPGGCLRARWRSKTWRAVRRQWLESADRGKGESISPISSTKVC